jgi:hypothetical protein
MRKTERFISSVLLVASMALAVSLASCGGAEPSKMEAPSQKVTYKCLSSSCDATVTCNPGDPIPEHCGKRMIR